MESSRNERECTFNPQLSRKPENLSFDNFLKSEQAFSDRHSQTMAESRKAKEMNEASQIQDRPNICPASVQIIMTRTVGNIAAKEESFSRLASGKSMIVMPTVTKKQSSPSKPVFKSYS